MNRVSRNGSGGSSWNECIGLVWLLLGIIFHIDIPQFITGKTHLVHTVPKTIHVGRQCQYTGRHWWMFAVPFPKHGRRNSLARSFGPASMVFLNQTVFHGFSFFLLIFQASDIVFHAFLGEFVLSKQNASLKLPRELLFGKRLLRKWLLVDPFGVFGYR